MTEEQQALLDEGSAIISKLSKAIDGASKRPAMFALTAFAVTICRQAGVPIEEFIAALRKTDREN